jgi:hypothetical protein
MSFNFLIQATRVLDRNNYDEDELKMIFDYVMSIDNEILIDYFNTCSILSYNNDLELYLEIVDSLIKIYEEREEYENCELLLIKKDESTIIMNKNTI